MKEKTIAFLVIVLAGLSLCICGCRLIGIELTNQPNIMWAILIFMVMWGGLGVHLKVNLKPFLFVSGIIGGFIGFANLTIPLLAHGK